MTPTDPEAQPDVSELVERLSPGNIFVSAPSDLTDRLVERGAAVYADDEEAEVTIVVEVRSPRPQRVVRLLPDEAVTQEFPKQLERWTAKRRANRLPMPDIRVESPAD